MNKTYYFNSTIFLTRGLISPFKTISHNNYSLLDRDLNESFDQFVIKKDNSFTVTISFIHFLYKDIFIKNIAPKLVDNTNYYTLIKIRYDGDLFVMAGKQISFLYNSNNNRILDELYDNIIHRLQAVMNEYNIEHDSILTIQLIFTTYTNEFISDLKTNDIVFNTPINTNIKKDLEYFPITNDPYIIGNSLKHTLDLDNKTVILNTNNIKDIDKDFILLKNTQKDSVIWHEKVQFFFRKSFKPYHILAITDIGNNTYNKEAYSCNGTLIRNIQDSIKSNNEIQRTTKASTLIFNEDKKLEYKYNILNFKPITKDLQKITRYVENNKIGVLDLEVFNAEEPKVYAGGIHTYMSNEPLLYYIDKNTLDSYALVLNIINELLRPKYKGITFYCHNFGRYDFNFILPVLLDFNLKNGETYKIYPQFKDNRVLKLVIKRKNVGKGYDSITICDSFSILNKSLHQLCKEFKVEVMKGIFPHDFANENTLFYKGETPDYKYYDFNNNVDPDKNLTTYNESIYKSLWDFKEEALKYLKDDLLSLFQVINKANHIMFTKFNISITESLTISGLANKIFRRHHYHKEVIPLINNKNIYEDIKQAYYGGCTEVYIPYGQNLYYYDVNSLYPYVALQPLPGLECTYIEYYSKNKDLDDLFGFYYCKIDTSDIHNKYLGLLPFRTKNSGILFPLGTWEGWYFSEELKLAKQYGYKIEVMKGYTFNKQEDIFKDYIENLYKIKATAGQDKSLKNVAKLFLNSLLGRFGLKIDSNITDIVDERKFDRIAATRSINSYVQLNKKTYLVNYNTDIDIDICKGSSVDISKVTDILVKNENVTRNKYDSVSVPISAAITAYGRMHMSKIKLDILNQKGKIYYTDTDSIVTNIKLDENPFEIGKLKLENNIKEVYFISNKTYCIVDQNDAIIQKAKGINKNQLTLEDYKNMYINNESISTIRKDFIRGKLWNWTKVHDVEVTINPDSYTKRMKIYDDNNRWVDTKPLQIQNNVIQLESNIGLVIWDLFKDKSLHNFIKGRFLKSHYFHNIINSISLYNIFKFVSGLALSGLLIYNYNFLQSYLTTLFSLCLGMRNEVNILSDTIPMLAEQISAVNANINTVLINTNNNFEIINMHLHYQDMLLNNIVYNFTTNNGTWNESYEDIYNHIFRQSSNIQNTLNNGIMNTNYLNNTQILDTSVILHRPGLNLHFNTTPSNSIIATNMVNLNLNNSIININPTTFTTIMNVNNNIGINSLHANNVVIQNAMDIIRSLSIRPDVEDLIEENLEDANKILKNNTVLGTTTSYISRLAFILGLISVGVVGGPIIKPVSKLIIATASNINS